MAAVALHARCAQQCHTSRARRPLQVAAAYSIRLPDGSAKEVSKDKFTIGTSSSCDLHLLAGAQHAAAQHAQIEAKGKQLFVRALVGEDTFDASYTFLDGQELRPRVAYVLGSGQRLAFGSKEPEYTVLFEQAAGGSPLMEMLVKGMAAKSSPDVKKMLDQSL